MAAGNASRSEANLNVQLTSNDVQHTVVYVFVLQKWCTAPAMPVMVNHP